MPSWQVWTGLGLLAMAAELLLPGAFLIWIGAAAVGTGLLVLLAAPGPVWSLLAYVLMLALGIGLSLRLLRPRRARPERALNTPAAGLVGRQGVMLTPERVRVGDSDWPAQGTGLAAGQPVAVVGVEGMTLLVRRHPG